MKKLDLKKLKEKSKDLQKLYWLNLDTSLVGGPGVGKTTWALEQAAHVASLYEGIPVFIIDTEAAVEPMLLSSDHIIEKFEESDADISILNVSEYVHKYGLVKGMEKTIDEIYDVAQELTETQQPGIMIVDSLSDLRNLLVDSFLSAKHGHKSLMKIFEDSSRTLQDWQKTSAILNDIARIAKNPMIHTIFTSREKLEKDGEKLVPMIDGHKQIEYECDAHIRLFIEQSIQDGKVTKVRKAEIIKLRTVRLKDVTTIEGTFEAFREFYDSLISGK